MTTAVWFRKNLRVHDNAALTAAADAKQILPLFCLDPAWATPATVGPNRCRFLLESLEDLDTTLEAKYGARLHVVVGDPEQTIAKLFEEGTITNLILEGEVCEPRELELERRILEAHPQATMLPSTHLLYDIDEALTKGNPPTKMPGMVKLAAKLGAPAKPLPAPATLPPTAPVTCTLPTLQSLGYASIPKDAAYGVKGGETRGLARLQEQMGREGGSWARAFEKPKTTSASWAGDPPTTLLSPYVAFGCVSARMFYSELKQVYAKGSHAQPPTSLLGQLYFREMSSLLGRFHGASFDQQPSAVCKDIDWDADAEAEKRLQAWEEGKTGYPLIDAAMRQLREQGWIHHLARHAVACFLTRGDLYVHWQRGRDVFDRDLLDADWAINNFNWLALSGVAPWSPPFFRVYNPVPTATSSLNVSDPQGLYVDRFVPELKGLSAKHKYAPWLAPLSDLNKAGVKLGVSYPRPLVDHKARSKENIARFKEAQRRAKEAKEAAAPSSKKRKAGA